MVTREQLDKGRDVAINCIISARNFWLRTITADFAKAVGVDRDEEDVLPVLRECVDRWHRHAGGKVVEHVEVAAAGEMAPVEACGYQFAVAWEAALHCVQVICRLADDGLISDAVKSENSHIYDPILETEHEALVARVRAEHARAVAALPVRAEPAWSVPMTLQEIGDKLSKGGMDTRTVKARYEHAMQKLNRQTWQIDLNQVPTAQRENFTRA